MKDIETSLRCTAAAWIRDAHTQLGLRVWGDAAVAARLRKFHKRVILRDCVHIHA
jgi:hypothetical protein